MGKSTGQRNISHILLLTILATAAALHAEPTPSPKPRSKTDAAAKIAPTTTLLEGWNYVKGEWIHSDGFKYLNGHVVRTTALAQKRPPRPPSKALLNSVKTKPPTPDPNSAAAKAAEKERNLRPRPAPQTGTNL